MDYVKKPIQKSLNDLATAKAQSVVDNTGTALPCSVTAVVGPGIVTVNFDINSNFTLPQVTVPIGYSQYILYPIAVGDKGVVMSADASLAAQSGLGSGSSTLANTGNLSNLVFFWLGSKSWTAPVDSTALELYQNLIVKPTALGFFGASAEPKQTLTGHLSAVTDTNARAVLLSIVTTLATYGLTINGTT